jgi:hypothetical protein
LIASPVLHRAAHNPRTTSTDDDVAQSDVAAADGAVPSRLKTAARRGSCAAFDFAHLASLNKGRSIGRVSKSWAVPTGRRVRRRGRKGMGGSLRRDPDMHQLGEGHVLRWPSVTCMRETEEKRRHLCSAYMISLRYTLARHPPTQPTRLFYPPFCCMQPVRGLFLAPFRCGQANSSRNKHQP